MKPSRPRAVRSTLYVSPAEAPVRGAAHLPGGREAGARAGGGDGRAAVAERRHQDLPAGGAARTQPADRGLPGHPRRPQEKGDPSACLRDVRRGRFCTHVI